MPRKPYKFTDARKAKFLLALRDGGQRVKEIEAVGLTRQTLKAHMDDDPLFAAAVQGAEIEALEEKTVKVKDSLFEAAQSGNVPAMKEWLQRFDRLSELAATRLEVSGPDGTPIPIAVLDIDNLTPKQLEQALAAIDGARRIIQGRDPA